MCGRYAVACEDFGIFKVPLCVGSVLWCVGTLEFFKVHCVYGPCVVVCGPCVVVCGDFEIFQSSHVCSMLWFVRTLSFQSSPVCGPCAVACVDSEFSQFFCAWALCCGV